MSNSNCTERVLLVMVGVPQMLLAGALESRRDERHHDGGDQAGHGDESRSPRVRTRTVDGEVADCGTNKLGGDRHGQIGGEMAPLSVEQAVLEMVDGD